MDRITNKQKNVVNELRNRTINSVTPKMLEDDFLFYRFAKARDFNLEAAENMLRNHIAWREEWKIDTILTDYEPPEVLVKYGTSSFVCFDKEGDIVRTQDFGRADSKGLCNSITKTELAKFFFFLLEQDIAAMFKNGGNWSKPIFSEIYDFEDWTYTKAADLKALQYFAHCVKMVVDNYPESVKCITVINAPIYFAWAFAGLKPILPASITQKLRIYATDGWKEALLKDIDADLLPAYLGGNKTDPDGNPLCETFIQRGKLVPKSYYIENRRKKLGMAPDAERIIVKPFSHEEISFQVQEENSYLEWEIEIKKGSIDFSLKFKEKVSEHLEPVIFIPKQKIDTSIGSEKGYFKCERRGFYTIVFENSQSWIQSKEVYFRVDIRSPKSNELYQSS